MKNTFARLTTGLACTAALVLTVTGCGSVAAANDQAGSSGGKDGKFRIVTVSKVEGITWFQRMSEGVDMFNEKFGTEVEAYQTGPAEGDPAQQVQIVEDLIAQGVDAIIVVPNDPEGIGPTLKKARDAGIIVGVTEATKLVGTDSIDFDIESFDNKEFGEGLGKGLAESMGGKGEYATSVGNLTSESHMLWLEAANNYIKKNHPEMKLVSETPYENDNDDQKGRNLAEEVLGTYPNLKGYLATTPAGGSGMASVLREKNRTDVSNVSLTLPSVAGPDLKEGFMSHGQGWDPAGWGWALNSVALKLLKKEKVESGQDLGWAGYEKIKVKDQLILGDDIQAYRPGDFPDGKYPF